MIRTIPVAGRNVELEGNPGDFYFERIELFNADHPEMEWFAAAHLPRDAVCLDIGANLGLTALILATLCPDGHVYAVEALPETAAFLRRNLERNGVRNCTVIETALGAETGHILFSRTDPHSPVSTPAQSYVVTDRHQGRARAQAQELPLTTLDALFDARPEIGRLDFIKLDVEGFEPAVISGGARTIERFRPPIFMEFNAWALEFAQGYSPVAWARALWDRFDVYSVREGGALEAAGGGDVARFLEHAMVRLGCLDDVLLRLKPGAHVPALPGSVMTPMEARLAAELAAMRASTSWRITAPMRALKQLLRGS
jgi:FkbM family methyltransferase